MQSDKVKWRKKTINKWLHWQPGSQNNNLIPSESSFQPCCPAQARETWPWRVCRHTYVDSWGCLPVLSAHTYRRRWEITMSRNWTIFTVMKRVTVKYLPIRSQRSSARLHRLELGWIIFFFVILKEIPGIERTGPWQHNRGQNTQVLPLRKSLYCQQCQCWLFQHVQTRSVCVPAASSMWVLKFESMLVFMN